MSQPRLVINTGAVVANWQALARASAPAACGAALKADAYGLGAPPLLAALARAGCRDVFVASWAEAAALGPLPPAIRVAVLHGITPAEMDLARTLGPAFAPVLNTPAQAALWQQTERPADAMVDTGINRLGLSLADLEAGVLAPIPLHTLHSHLACADTPGHPQNALQLSRFHHARAHFPQARAALANTAGIALGPAYHFALTRPGIGLYGGGPTPGESVLTLLAPLLQVRQLAPGDSIGYGASFTAPAPLRVATAALGYADGYPRALAGTGHALHQGQPLPLLGRISMDLIVIDITAAPDLQEGDALEIAFPLAQTARAAARTDYELLTGLGARYIRTYR
jgi:alanine racemase